MSGILWAIPIERPAVLPRYKLGSPHHITLQYGVEREYWEHLIGLPITVGVIEECWNDRIQALRIALPTWVACQIPNPHISVSWILDAAPVAANAMLNESHESAPVDFEAIHCLIEWQEWGAKPVIARSWRDRSPVMCPTCTKQGIQTLVRSLSGYCRKHRNG